MKAVLIVTAVIAMQGCNNKPRCTIPDLKTGVPAIAICDDGNFYRIQVEKIPASKLEVKND